jgi:hypothetical protein
MFAQSSLSWRLACSQYLLSWLVACDPNQGFSNSKTATVAVRANYPRSLWIIVRSIFLFAAGQAITPIAYENRDPRLVNLKVGTRRDRLSHSDQRVQLSSRYDLG